MWKASKNGENDGQALEIRSLTGLVYHLHGVRLPSAERWIIIAKLAALTRHLESAKEHFIIHFSRL